MTSNNHVAFVSGRFFYRLALVSRFFLGRTLSVLTLSSAMALGACQSVSTTSGGEVGVDRKQFVMVSAEQVEQSSAEAYREIMAKAQKEGKLNTDRQMYLRVKAIADRMIPHTAAFRSDAPGWAWEVNVLEDEQLNAWCMAGGKIAFYSGLIKELNLTDDEIAAVMGHEIAHALREHSRERMSQQMVTGLGLDLISMGFGLSTGASELANMAANVAISMPYGRKHEVESDRIGVELAARSGYNPKAAIGLWAKMQQKSGNGTPELLSTHPSPENRMRDLTIYSERVMPLYEKARR